MSIVRQGGSSREASAQRVGDDDVKPCAAAAQRDGDYPAEVLGDWGASDGIIARIRPIAAGDGDRIRDFVHSLSSETRYMRFMGGVKELGAPMIDRLTRIDHRRDAALIASVNEGGVERIVGVVRYALDNRGRSGEFALVIADDWQRRGLGRRLMTALVDTAAARGLKRISGQVLAINWPMLALMRALGFRVRESNDDATMLRVDRDVRRDPDRRLGSR